MKRSHLAIISSFLILLIGGFGLYWFLVRPRLAPPTTIPPSEKPVITKPAAPESPLAVLNLYLAGPTAVTGKVARVEMTLIGAEISSADGKTESILKNQVRLVVQKDVVEKVIAAIIPSGQAGELTLKFLPSAKIISTDGSVMTAFLPSTTTKVGLNAAPPSGTIAALVRFDLDGRFGVKNNVPTYTPPETVKADMASMGGAMLDDRSIGNIFSLPNATITAAVKADTGLDVSAGSGASGSSGYVPPTKPAGK